MSEQTTGQGQPEIIKLVNGDEIIGRSRTDGGAAIAVSDALQLITVPQEGGQVGLGFMPYMPYIKGDVIIMTSAVVAVAEPNDQLLETYTRHFSKIVLPPSGIVTV